VKINRSERQEEGRNEGAKEVEGGATGVVGGGLGSLRNLRTKGRTQFEL